MFVAKSFSYTSGKRRKPGNDEKAAMRDPSSSPSPEHRGFGWRPESFPKFQQGQECRNAEQRTSSIEAIRDHDAYRSADAPSSTFPAPSKPVAVPSRPSSRHQYTPRSSPNQHAKSTSRRTGSRQPHDPKAMSPSVSALLAMTSIPKPKAFPRPRPRAPMRRVSIDEVVDEWRQADFQTGTPPGVSPAMDVLLSPPPEDGDLSSEMGDEASCSPSRSTSSDSVPSLGRDSSSGVSWSIPSTPEISFRGGMRPASTPRSVDSSSQHPLLPPTVPEEPQEGMEDAELRSQTTSSTPTLSPSRTSSTSRSTSRSRLSSRKASTPRSAPSQTSSFKSNLSASISHLRNSITRSFANFAGPSAPSTLSDDHLTRSLLGPPYSSEMRPRPITGTPTPQMRRYMNPHAIHLYDFHLHDSHIDNADLEYVAAANAAAAEARASGDPNAPAAPEVDVIPLDTYVHGTMSKRGAATEAGRAMELAEARGQQQRREPRENPEFLRIAVLEMQMRRAGKVEGPVGGGLLGAGGAAGAQVGTGRRGWFLPPRADSLAAEERGGSLDGARRWRGDGVANA